MAATLEERQTVAASTGAAFDAQRVAEIDRRHQLLAECASLTGCDGLILREPENIAWLTVGSELHGFTRGGCRPALFLTAEARLAVCQNVDSAPLFTGPLRRLGFQLKERPWEQPLRHLLRCLSHGRTLACDGHLKGCTEISAKLADFRRVLGDHEQSRLKSLGRDLAEACESMGRHCRPAMALCELRGEMMHRLMRENITPVETSVFVNGQPVYEPNLPPADADPPIISLQMVGRRDGLILGVARSLTFGGPSDEAVRAVEQAGMILATGLACARAGSTTGDLFDRIHRIYEKLGRPDDWRSSRQAELTGYARSEGSIAPGGRQPLNHRQPVYCHPAIGPVVAGDSGMIGTTHAELVTTPARWPRMIIRAAGASLPVAGLLIRERGND